jgi:hypothetical protein
MLFGLTTGIKDSNCSLTPILRLVEMPCQEMRQCRPAQGVNQCRAVVARLGERDTGFSRLGGL